MDARSKTHEIERATEESLAGRRLDAARIESLLEARGPAEDAALERAAARVTAAFHGRVVRVFAPLYYSNVCVNNCLYCGFRRDNADAARRVLSGPEIEEEARALLAIGHRRILLVASEDPSERGLALQVEAVRRVRGAAADGRRAAQVGVELAPGGAEQFRALAGAGVDQYILFQETYDRALYARIHPEGPKRDYDWRLSAPERALEAGIPSVGLGVLLGLKDPAEDLLALIAHARAIEDACGRPPRTISLPRMEPAEGSELSRHPYRPVADEEMLRLLAVARLALPRAGIILSARESAPFRERALAWGITEMSAGSRTEPGGYAVCGDDGLAQFELQDGRSFEEITSSLRGRGYEPYTGGDARPAEEPAGEQA